MSELVFETPQKARALVLTVHGHQTSKDWGFFPWLAEYLCEAGLVAARFTMGGDSYAAHVDEVVAAAEQAASRFRGLPLFLLGHSLGGAIALLAAEKIDDLAGVVTWSAIGNHPDVLAAASRMRGPLLAIHGSTDKHVPLEDARMIVERASDASLMVIEGASHTFNSIHPLVIVPRELEHAALVSAHFVRAYS